MAYISLASGTLQWRRNLRDFGCRRPWPESVPKIFIQHFQFFSNIFLKIHKFWFGIFRDPAPHNSFGLPLRVTLQNIFLEN